MPIISRFQKLDKSVRSAKSNSFESEIASDISPNSEIKSVMGVVSLGSKEEQNLRSSNSNSFESEIISIIRLDS